MPCPEHNRHCAKACSLPASTWNTAGVWQQQAEGVHAPNVGSRQAQLGGLSTIAAALLVQMVKQPVLDLLHCAVAEAQE